MEKETGTLQKLTNTQISQLESKVQIPPKPESTHCDKCDCLVEPYYEEPWLFHNGEWKHGNKWRTIKTCKECEKKQNERDERQARYDWMIKSGLTQSQLKMTFDKFKVNDKNKAAYTGVLEFSEKPIGGIFLYGDCGCGKTHLSSATAIKLFESHKSFSFVTVPELLFKLRCSFNKNGSSTEQEIYEQYTSNNCLFLDDLGAEKVTEWSLEVLYLIIDTKMRNMSPMFISSNKTLGEIGKNFSDRIASRIAGYCKVYEIKDIDHRVNK